MIPSLGPNGAAELQRKMTELMAGVLRRFRLRLSARKNQISLQIHFSSGDSKRMEEWLGPDFIYHPQAQGSLTERLISAFHSRGPTFVMGLIAFSFFFFFFFLCVIYINILSF